MKKKYEVLEVRGIDFEGARRGSPVSCPVSRALIRQGNHNVNVGKGTCIFDTGKKTLDFIFPKELRTHIDTYDRTGKKFTGTFALLKATGLNHEI